MYRGLPDKHLVWGDSMLNCLNRFTYIILMASNCYEHWPSRHCQVCCTIQFGLKNRAGGWVWCVDGLGRVRANDDIIARCREWEETITLLSGMLARTVQVRSPVTPGPVSCSALDLDTGPGSCESSSSRRAGPGPGSRVLFSPESGQSGVK